MITINGITYEIDLTGIWTSDKQPGVLFGIKAKIKNI